MSDGTGWTIFLIVVFAGAVVLGMWAYYSYRKEIAGPTMRKRVQAVIARREAQERSAAAVFTKQPGGAGVAANPPQPAGRPTLVRHGLAPKPGETASQDSAGRCTAWRGVPTGDVLGRHTDQQDGGALAAWTPPGQLERAI